MSSYARGVRISAARSWRATFGSWRMSSVGMIQNASSACSAVSLRRSSQLRSRTSAKLRGAPRRMQPSITSNVSSESKPYRLEMNAWYNLSCTVSAITHLQVLTPPWQRTEELSSPFDATSQPLLRKGGSILPLRRGS